MPRLFTPQPLGTVVVQDGEPRVIRPPGRFGGIIGQILPQPLLRPLVNSLPGGDGRAYPGDWLDWARSPAGIVTLGLVGYGAYRYFRK